MLFPKNPYPGLFIAIEGLDGSGSSTQITLLERKLKVPSNKIFTTKEPTNGEIGKLVRKVLTKKIKIPPVALQLLFTADRSHHLQQEIVPALQKDSVVITERYFWSTIAFGSIDVDFDWLVTLNKKFVRPDITFFLNVSPKMCIQRIKQSRPKTELFESENRLARVEVGYKKIIRKFPKSIVIINGEQTREVVNTAILRKLRQIDGPFNKY